MLVAFDFLQVRFCGLDNSGLVGDDFLQAVDELSQLLSCDPPTVFASGRKLGVRACGSGNFVSMTRTPSLTRNDRWFEVCR